MSPVTHALIGWLTANTAKLDRRERAAVVVAGVIPDLDGLGVIAEALTRGSERPLLWWSEYHHVLAHNLSFGLLTGAAAFLLAGRRWKTALLALASFHLHLLCDLAGSRSPDGFQWPIAYLWPFSGAWQWTWQGQWEVNAWQNIVATLIALAVTFYLAWRRGYSPLEMISPAADHRLVDVLRRRFPKREE